jgi:prephenate dehydrogenase
VGKLAIIGLGLIGGSIGLALRRYDAENTEVIGYDTNREVMERALKAKVVNGIAPTPEHAVRDATMVIVATPIITIRKVFQSIAPHLQRGALVTDTASTKSDVLKWADDILPKTVYFVGGHPMAGKEKMGLHHAEVSLFDEKPYAIVPAVDAVPGAVNALVGFAEALGARPMYFDADEHDSYVAAISHLPLLTSVALFNLASGSNAWPELAGLSGPGFRDLTRLASGEAEMSHDIFLTNKENVLHWLNRYIGELHKLSDLIENREETQALFRTLTETQMARDKYLEELPEHESPLKHVDLPSSSEAFMTMLTGTLWQQRAKEVTEALQEQTREREREVRMRRRTLDDED